MAINIPKIQNFEELLQPVVSDSEIINYNTKLLIGSGENYGSVLLSVEVIVQDKKNDKKILNFVVKVCPSNEWIQKMFASKITFKKEIGFYKEVAPVLINFQMEHNVPEAHLLNIFPKYFNSRINMDLNSDEVDNNAILILENLLLNGYKTLDRLVGFDLPETELVLKDLARFHAVPLAFKIKKPDEFKYKIMPFLNRICVGQDMIDIAEERFTECLYRHLNLSNEELKRFKDGMSLGFNFQNNFPCGNEQYATIVHCDYWINNTMIQFENEKPLKNKMLDFQLATYGAPATDLLFFLFTSVQLDILFEHYDYFLKIYHQSFLNCLKELHCDITEYTFDSFLNEVNYYGPREISHILIMLRVIFKNKGEGKNVEDVNLEDMFVDHGLTEVYRNRLKLTVNKFFDKNWF